MKMRLLYLVVILFTLNGCPQTATTTAEPSGAVVAAKVPATGTGTLVIKPITYAKDAYIREAVKKECQLIEKLGQFIEQNAAPNYAEIVSSSRSRKAQVLSIKIEQVQGGAGGAWSGAKVVLINGKLTQNGKVLGDFKARRYSGGGMFGGYKGTCAILGRCVRTLGKDVAQWLQNPTHHAVLGDM